MGDTLIRSGDTLLFSGNTTTNIVLKFFTSSPWAHVGIAIRLLPNKKISLTGEGNLYVLEINAVKRYDILSNRDVDGIALTDYNWQKNNYNYVAVRQIKDQYRTPKFAKAVSEFIMRYHGVLFAQNSAPFVGVWLGLPFAAKHKKKNEMFCSEMTAVFYEECLGEIVAEEQDIVYTQGELRHMFGPDSPVLPYLYIPGAFSQETTPKATIYKGKEVICYKSEGDWLQILIQPLLITLLIMVLLSMSLPD